MLELNAKTTALVVIDLQEGILPFAGGPHTADEVVNRAGKLAAKFRASGQPVFLVRVGWSAEDACSAASAEQHNNSINHIYPRIARVRSVEEILHAL